MIHLHSESGRARLPLRTVGHRRVQVAATCPTVLVSSPSLGAVRHRCFREVRLLRARSAYSEDLALSATPSGVPQGRRTRRGPRSRNSRLECRGRIAECRGARGSLSLDCRAGRKAGCSSQRQLQLATLSRFRGPPSSSPHRCELGQWLAETCWTPSRSRTRHPM